MFYISHITGRQTPYDIDTLRALREQDRVRVDGVTPIAAVKTSVKGSYRYSAGGNSQRKRAILAHQIMSSPVVTVHPEASVAHVLELFSSHRFRHIPVVSAEIKLVGIASDRDILPVQQTETPVAEIMHTDVLSARPHTEIRSIAEILHLQRISAMPIVDKSEVLVGILTSDDILRTLVNNAPLELWI